MSDLDLRDDETYQKALLLENTSKIKKKILVLSGKGGVGKSTIAVNIAFSLAMMGFETGLLDVDIHGPSIPKLLGMDNCKIKSDGKNIIPMSYSSNFKAVSMGFLLENESEPVIWRGPMKMTVIKQFLKDVSWGELDYLIVDCPPGTGDEPLSVIQLIDEVDGAVIVTTPQQLAISDVKKSINFCRMLKVPVLGIVENMSGFICPSCGVVTDIFESGGGEKLAKEMNLTFLGKIPIDPRIVTSGDNGKPFIYNFAQSQAAEYLEKMVNTLLNTGMKINSNEGECNETCNTNS